MSLLGASAVPEANPGAVRVWLRPHLDPFCLVPLFHRGQRASSSGHRLW
jgi:hypothetical protein